VIVGLLTLAALGTALLAARFGDLLDRAAVGTGSYIIIAALVAGDAVIPILPGETTLNSAAVLAAQGRMDVLLICVAGSIGAIVGDSIVFWIARGSSGWLHDRLASAAQHERLNRVIEIFGRAAPLAIVFGRYVPGVRLAVNFAMGGLVGMPWPRFLVWSAIGGTSWATYTTLLAYAVGTALSGFPVASVVISGLVTTVILAILIWVFSRKLRQLDRADGSPESLTRRV
jgi:membrane protein DedA with SNARE-associated domain